MKTSFKFTFYNGDELIKNQLLLETMNKICNEYDMGEILNFLESESIVCYMTLEDELMGFSWIFIHEEKHMAELCWFVTNKQKLKGLDGMILLDKTLEFCKGKNVNKVKFNCAVDAWWRINNKNILLSKYGYNIDENEKEYDVSIRI